MKAQYERIERKDFQSFGAYAYEKKEFDTPWHYHPEFELTYITSGRGIRYVGNGFEYFEEDDLVLLGPNLPHCWKNNGKQQGNPSQRSGLQGKPTQRSGLQGKRSQRSVLQDKSGAIVIHWDNNFLGSNKEFSSISELFLKAQYGVKFNSDFSKKMKEKFLVMLDSSPFDRLIIFLSILHELATTKHKQVLNTTVVDASVRNYDHQRMNTVYQFVRNNYQEKVTLAQIASEVHMSEEAFSRFFSKLMSKPFFTFLNEYRINAACQMLIETDQAISEVAMASGFDTLPFFYRQFNKIKKLSPKKFRDNFRSSLHAHAGNPVP